MTRLLISVVCTSLVVLSAYVVTSVAQPPSAYQVLPRAGADPFGAPAVAEVEEEEETKAAEAGDEPEDPEAKKRQEEEKKKAARQQKLQKLTFDRRPSHILKEWAKSTEPPEPESEEDPPEDTSEEDPDKEKPEPDPFDEELKQFQRNVTLGNWPDVKSFLASLSEEEGKTAYRQLLQSLRNVPKGVPPGLPPELEAQFAQMIQARNAQQGNKSPEHNKFSFDDVIALADAAPIELEKEDIASLGSILQLPIRDGNAIESLMAHLEQVLTAPDDKAIFTRRQVAQLLMAAGQVIEAGKFLPSVEEAREEKDHQALNLLSRYYLAMHAEEKEPDHLDEAWHVTQAVFSLGDIKKEEREEALRRAVELAPKVREEFGQKWLNESFTDEPQRGIEIIAAIGSAAATGLQTHARDANFRLKSLQFQTTAVEALLEASIERADQWKEMLDLLAANWLREAVVSYQRDQSSGSGPRLRRDRYGNYFYFDENEMMHMPRSTGSLQAVKTTELLEIKPGQAWMDRVSESMRPKFDMMFAQLYLKVDEEDKAFPYIEQLASQHPDMAEDLVDEFLRVWTRNHDPNASRNRTNYYMYMYGYERKAESIPLTRSKQERNLKELAELVKRLKALPLGELNEQLLTRAFTTCHSSAEVYRLEAIESVFGSLDDLEPKTLAELAQQMRANLIGVWRQPAVQEDKKTKRKQKDIQAEVLRGYVVARQVIEGGLQKHPDHWALQLAKASLDHDENNYRQEIAKSSEYSERRSRSFAEFQKAAELYAAQSKGLREDEETTRVYELWYYASLGACDLQHVREDNVPDLRQPALIRQSIQALADEAADRHMAMFANTLFTRMSAVNPAVKYRYVKNGLDIVGDHKRAQEARKVFDYYKDLVTELKLETVVDGSDVVGHERPFGVFVNIRHTREIERESGGFGRYLQNQNTSRSYRYNYGRPTEDYRDKFEEIVQQAMSEQFEVLSVTFQTDDVNSKAMSEYGWRRTPYAYLLLKARGPEVDKIPPVRLDLDFLDTSGYAIIPIESPAVPIDASPADGEPRPIQNLAITQTLDERQAAEGKLILEIKATAQGLVPKIEDFLSVEPEYFDVVETEDQGLSVSQFDTESEATLVLSERTWMVTMQAQEDLPELPKAFSFAQALLPTKEVVYQRYVDADLLAVDQQISLEQQYGELGYTWIWGVVVGVLAVMALVIVWRLTARKAPEVVQERFGMPEEVTPFTVLGLLKHIQSNNGLDDTGQQELTASITRLERHYFSPKQDEAPNLHEIAESWLRRAR